MEEILKKLDPEYEKNLSFFEKLRSRKYWNYIGFIIVAVLSFLALVIGRNETSYLVAGFSCKKK
jgi:hypothetical protein